MFIQYREICHTRLIETKTQSRRFFPFAEHGIYTIERVDSIIAGAGTHNVARAYATESVNRNFSWITLYTDPILYLSILST